MRNWGTKRSRVHYPILWATLSTLALIAVACAGQSDEAFRIGVMESLTGPGETYGTVANQSKQMAADEINATGGINGRPLELIVEDSQCSAQAPLPPTPSSPMWTE